MYSPLLGLVHSCLNDFLTQINDDCSNLFRIKLVNAPQFPKYSLKINFQTTIDVKKQCQSPLLTAELPIGIAA